jgi:hypothetical protein
MTMQEFKAAEDRLNKLLSELLPLARNPNAGIPPNLAPAAGEFRQLWTRLAHKPLAPYYRAINPAWFDALGL